MRVAGIMGMVSAICGGIDLNGLVRDVIDGIRRERMARNIRRRWPGHKAYTQKIGYQIAARQAQLRLERRGR